MVGAVKVKCVQVRSEGWSPHKLKNKEIYMRLTNSKEIMEFRFAVSKCKGQVWLEDQEGNKFNLKSVIS